MSTRKNPSLWLPTASEDDDYLGPYRVIKKVGSGGMGIVYLGADPTDKPVAVKVLREHIADDPSARSRLRRELNTLQRVRHRCVAGVVDSDLENDPAYIVTEFISGPQLDTYIDDVGPLSRAGLVNLGHGLIGALRAIHEVDVVHRDLKPGNILLFEERPVVIDFGIAQLADDIRLTVTGLFVGTPGYVAPEVIEGARSTPATDWWGWAATLAFAATGRPPAGKGPIEVVLDRIRRGALDLEGVDEDIAPLLRDCLMPDPASRPGINDIVRRFKWYAEGRTTSDGRPVVVPSHADPAAMSGQDQSSQRQPTAILDQPTAAGSPRNLIDRPMPTNLSPRSPGEPEPDNVIPPHSYVRAVAPTRQERALAPLQTTSSPLSPYGRTGTIAAYALLLVALTAAIPFIGAGLTFLSIACARFVDRFVEGFHRRQSSVGPRRSNLVKEILASPWRLVTSSVLAVGSLLVPAAVGGGLTLAASQAIKLNGGRLDTYIENAVIAVAMAIALLITWWGPGGTSVRRSARRTAHVFAPGTFGAVLCATVFILGAAFIGLLVLSFPTVNWWPLTNSPLSWH